MMGIIIQAVRDTGSDDPSLAGDAREWLRSDTCLDMCEACGISHTWVINWVNSGCENHYLRGRVRKHSKKGEIQTATRGKDIFIGGGELWQKKAKLETFLPDSR